ncbi:MAG: carbon-nitrogen hydrolase [Pseudomonadales bacterium]
MSKARKLKIGVVQMSMTDVPADNTDAAEHWVRQAAEQGAELVCLPELFRSRYFCQTEDYAPFQLAEAVPGPTTDRFAELARELDIAIVLSLFEERAAGLYHNTAALVDGAHGYVGKYRKMHIPDDPRYYEKFYFTPGDLGFKVYPAKQANLGLLVCWDQWYPEAARLTALMGAQLLVYPTAIGWHPEEQAAVGKAQHSAWETIQRSHAIANGCYVVAANRTGFEPDPSAASAANSGIRFWGQSFVVAPDGTIIARAGEDEQTVLVVELDFARIATQRQGWPFLRDRRIDAYAPIERRYLDGDR